MSGEGTPISVGKKRELSSPEFDNELKKNKSIHIPLPASPDSDLELDKSEPEFKDTSEVSASEISDGMEATPTPEIEPVSHISIPPSEMMKIAELLRTLSKGK